MVIQCINGCENVIINCIKVKLNYLREIVKNIPSRLPLFERSEKKKKNQTLFEMERKYKFSVKTVYNTRANQQ